MSGEIYLELKPNSKTADVAQYFVDLCKDMHKDNVDKLFIALDNNSTHKEKMKRQLKDHLQSAGLADKISVEFIHTPTYSPDFNLAEYGIYLLGLQKLHH